MTASLKGLLVEELEQIAVAESAPRYAARQLLEWLYRRGVDSFTRMTNLRRSFRDALSRRYRLREAAIADTRETSDGVVKFLVRLNDGSAIESVAIPERKRVTLCVSTQVGCARACVFCATGQMGLSRNLTAGEILDQVVLARRRFSVSNVVFMGMGEPLDNYENVQRAAILLTSPRAFGFGQRHVTVSTVGVVPNILRMAKDRVPARLTVSLGAADDDLRARLLPSSRRWPLADLISSLKEYSRLTGHGVTLAYVLVDGVNDSPAHAEKFARLVRELDSGPQRRTRHSTGQAKVNLIACNEATGFRPPSGDALFSFQGTLKKRGVLALIRRERGGEIGAACGQLAAAGGEKT